MDPPMMSLLPMRYYLNAMKTNHQDVAAERSLLRDSLFDESELQATRPDENDILHETSCGEDSSSRTLCGHQALKSENAVLKQDGVWVGCLAHVIKKTTASAQHVHNNIHNDDAFDYEHHQQCRIM